MCGIVALWNRDRHPLDLQALRRAVRSLRHRGPDDEGYVLIDTGTGRTIECWGEEPGGPRGGPRLEELTGEPFDLALGHRRLSVVDLSSAGHQPMGDGHGRSWIVFNGMIHNFRDLRRELEARGHVFRSATDTEVVLRAYREWGRDCLGHFNGMWAFVLWDQESRHLFASRDRLGIKPLLLYADDRTVALSSELKGLVHLPRVPRQLDPEALHHYLSLMKVPAPFTIYERIRKISPGHSLVIGARQSISCCYWSPTVRPRPIDAAGDAAEEIDAVLRDSVRLRLAADVPVGAFLSGGLDSSLIAALAAQEASTPLHTFSVSFPSLADHDESPWAQLVARHVGTRHRSVELSFEFLRHLPEMVRLFDEPFAVSSVMGLYLLAREAAQRVKVVLSGDGGDELFGGYRERYADVDELWRGTAAHLFPRLSLARARARAQPIRWEPAGLGRRLAVGLRALALPARQARDDAFNQKRMIFNDAEKHSLYARAWRERVRDVSTLRFLGSTLYDEPEQGVRRWQLHDIRTSLHDEMLTKLDKATMAWGIEGRVPFLDHRLVDLAVSLPDPLKIGDGQVKRILRSVAARYLPAAIVTREKQGFTIPLSHWFRAELHSFVRDALSPPAIRRAGVFRPRAVEQIIAYYQVNPSFLTAHMVFVLLCFQLWHDSQTTVAA